jgi:hypothetical protein
VLTTAVVLTLLPSMEIDFYLAMMAVFVRFGRPTLRLLRQQQLHSTVVEGMVWMVKGRVEGLFLHACLVLLYCVVSRGPRYRPSGDL